MDQATLDGLKAGVFLAKRGGGTFFREFTRSPGKVGSIAPSSKFLADEMVEAADIQPGHVVVELGAGTGPVTRRISQEIDGNPFLALEPNPEMAKWVREQVPEAKVVEGFAQDLPMLMERWGHPKADRIISSLPFAGWPEAVQDEVMEAVLNALAPNGRMVTFSYLHAQVLPGALRFKKKLHGVFTTIEKSKPILANVPPAFVYICDKD
jgi:phospholipid N-methyltransferase